MDDDSALAGLIASLRAAVEIVKAMRDADDAGLTQRKVPELTRETMSALSSALATQSEHFDLLLRVRFKSSSRVTKLSQHQPDGGKFQERESIAVEILPVLGEAAASVEPRNRAFDNPTLG